MNRLVTRVGATVIALSMMFSMTGSAFAMNQQYKDTLQSLANKAGSSWENGKLAEAQIVVDQWLELANRLSSEDPTDLALGSWIVYMNGYKSELTRAQDYEYQANQYAAFFVAYNNKRYAEADGLYKEWLNRAKAYATKYPNDKDFQAVYYQVLAVAQYNGAILLNAKIDALYAKLTKQYDSWANTDNSTNAKAGRDNMRQIVNTYDEVFSLLKGYSDTYGTTYWDKEYVQTLANQRAWFSNAVNYEVFYQRWESANNAANALEDKKDYPGAIDILQVFIDENKNIKEKFTSKDYMESVQENIDSMNTSMYVFSLRSRYYSIYDRFYGEPIKNLSGDELNAYVSELVGDAKSLQSFYEDNNGAHPGLENTFPTYSDVLSLLDSILSYQSQIQANLPWRTTALSLKDSVEKYKIAASSNTNDLGKAEKKAQLTALKKSNAKHNALKAKKDKEALAKSKEIKKKLDSKNTELKKKAAVAKKAKINDFASKVKVQ